MLRVIWALYIMLVLLGSTFGQCINNVDFNTWSRAETSSGTGVWSVLNGGADAYQAVNSSNPTFFISPYDLINVEITGTFRSDDGDDDWIGFVFGHKAPISQPLGTYDTWIFDWKQANQDECCRGLFGLPPCDRLPRGRALARVNGNIPPSGTSCNNFDQETFGQHKNRPPRYTIRAGVSGGGWTRSVDHQFRLVYTLTRATIYVDNQLVFDVQDCFQPGRFGFYNLSQSKSTYKNFQYTLSIDFNIQTPTVCTGQPAQMQFLDPTCASNYDYSLITSLVWDWGDGTNTTDTNPSAATVNPTHIYNTPGTYTVSLTLTDANGCSSSATGTVTVNGATGSIAGGTACVGDPINFTTNVTTNGVIGNWTWDFGDGNTSNSQNPSHTYTTPNTYNVTLVATDGTGCATTFTTTATALNLPVITNVLVTDVSCNGAADGGIDITTNSAGLIHNWTPGNISTEDISNIGPGAYTVVVTDNVTGCSTTSIAYNVSEPAILNVPGVVFAYANGFNVSCNGSSDGSIDISPTGGTAPYNYLWMPGNITTEDINNIPAGTYTVDISDFKGCSFTNTFTLTEPPTPGVTFTTSSYIGGFGVSCYGASDGNIDITVNIAASFVWSHGPTTEDLNNIPAGTYTVTVTPQSGCPLEETIVITEPNELIAIDNVTDQGNGFGLACNGDNDGQVDVVVTGGSGTYSYLWDDGTTTEDRSGLSAGIYNLTVTDENLCTDQITVNIDPPTALQTYLDSSSINCYNSYDGSLWANVNGGVEPYQYFWSNGDTNYIISDLSGGTYLLTITDDNGCTSILSATLAVPDRHYVDLIPFDTLSFGDTTEITPVYFANDRYVTFDWTPIYQIVLTNPEEPLVFPWGTTIYQVEMTDDQGCVDIAQIEIIIKTEKVLYVPNIFTPNGDNLNDGFHVYAKGVRDALVQVFDRWGELIFETREFSGDRTTPWLGTHISGKKARPGVYTYRVSVAYEDGELLRKAGSVTLKR